MQTLAVYHLLEWQLITIYYTFGFQLIPSALLVDTCHGIESSQLFPFIPLFTSVCFKKFKVTARACGCYLVTAPSTLGIYI